MVLLLQSLRSTRTIHVSHHAQFYFEYIFFSCFVENDLCDGMCMWVGPCDRTWMRRSEEVWIGGTYSPLYKKQTLVTWFVQQEKPLPTDTSLQYYSLVLKEISSFIFLNLSLRISHMSLSCRIAKRKVSSGSSEGDSSLAWGLGGLNQHHLP